MENSDHPERRQRGRPRAFNEKTEQNTIKSLDRALLVLTELARLESASLSELSQSMGESPATVYRVLTTLSLHGIVETVDHTQTWHIGPNAFLIGSVFLRRTSLVESSRPVLRTLMEQTGETANLGIEKDGSVLFVSQVETHAPIRAFFPPGTVSPLHASGIGKILLAAFTQDRLEKFATQGLEKFTEHTNADLASLSADLEIIRTRGYSVDDQERNLGMRCIAAPIHNAYGEVVAGISVSGPTSRVSSDQVEEFATAVKSAAAAVSAALGAQTG
jgi:IclR family acetate operon transcriptional repressor